ncbi:MerR family transcriptional regulator [Jiangella anatolica]|uniref:MerR family transcriptional regulator n=1 Tax=Jiangella anatolica TaxID=2670374 RepID=A0A2W2C062_9ACTN|nr:MerR family transcriptional regulator [Jiangella anatolica]PZF85498.1 MerR family transcriptional regulator [Jiangella anatolica]
MRIGDLARRTGTTTRALRFYESQGLLMAQRAPNGYREYDEDDLRLVNEIQTLQDIGFSLDDTRPFVECLRSGHDSGDSCADSIETYRRKLAEIDGYLERLTAIRADIQARLEERP